jgi:uncharacterized protein (UPF0332 family)
MKKFKPHAVDWAQIERFLASADKKLVSARKILAFDEEACLQQAYEAMLKACSAMVSAPGANRDITSGLIERVTFHSDAASASFG